MKEVKQKVDYYYDLYDAYREMSDSIERGWRIHTCMKGTHVSGYSVHETVLVVYEKEEEKK